MVSLHKLTCRSLVVSVVSVVDRSAVLVFFALKKINQQNNQHTRACLLAAAC